MQPKDVMSQLKRVLLLRSKDENGKNFKQYCFMDCYGEPRAYQSLLLRCNNIIKSTGIRLIHLYWYYQHPTMSEPNFLWHCIKQARTRTTNWVMSSLIMSHSSGQVVSKTGLWSKEFHSCHWRSFFKRTSLMKSIRSQSDQRNFGNSAETGYYALS